MVDRHTPSRRALLATTMLAIAAPAAALARPAERYRDAATPIVERVRDLLSRMTLEEKVAQMRCLWFGKAGFLDEAGVFSEDKASRVLSYGVGQIGRPSDTAGTKRFSTAPLRGLDETLTLINAIQKRLVEQTRLGIPALFHEETAHGLATAGATSFPIPLGLGGTWDPDLIEQVFTVAAREARLSGATIALSPVIDLAREPRFGRIEECFGEDPYLVARMGLAAVRGHQGRTRPLGKDRVFATLKHFIHGAPQGGLNLAPADMSERSLRETYLVPFEHIIRHGAPAIVMPSYNEVQGVPSHASKALLQETGRQRLGFKGAYFSDYNGVTNLLAHHHIVATDEEAAILALNAGIDAELPDGKAFARLPALVRAGRVDESKIDAAVARILALKFEAGLFENPYLDAGRARREINTAGDITLARLAAQKAIVLLKNDGVLPLDPKALLKLAVIGPNAAPVLLGGYSGVNDKAVGVLAGVKAAAGSRISIEYAEGVRIIEPEPGNGHKSISPIKPADPVRNAELIAQAAQVAKRSDVVLLVVGDVPQVTREAIMVNAPGDRSTLGLFGDQDALVEAVLAAGKPVIALLLNGRPLTITRLADGANAVIEGWYLGQEGGNAFADVLFGKTNPGGKLTVSFPRSEGELPAYYNPHVSAGIHRYIERRRTALFPFGYGLSYTRFELSPPRLRRATITAGERAIIEVDVTNVGALAGDEVVQLYVRDEVSSVPRPIMELRGFQRLTLTPGEKRTVTFELGSDDLAFWTLDMTWAVEPGAFTILTGANSVDLQSTTLTVT